LSNRGATLWLAVALTLWASTAAAGTSARAALETGQAWAELGDWRRAADHFRKAVALEPGSSTAHLRLAQALVRAGDRQAAQGELRALAGMPALGAGDLSSLGSLWQELGDRREACAAFERALAGEPRQERSLYGRAECALARTQAPGGPNPEGAREAEACLQAYLDVHPQGAHALPAREALEKLRLGAAGARLAEARDLLAAGKVRLAEETLRALLASQPELEEAHYLLGLCLGNPVADRVEEATAEFRRAPHVKEAMLQLGLAELESGELEEARRRLEAAVALDPTFGEPYYHLGLTWLELQAEPRVDAEQARAEARRAFEKLVALAPDSPLARRAASKLQLLSGEVRALDEGEVLDGAKEIELGRKLTSALESQFGLGHDAVQQARLDGLLTRLAESADGRPDPGRYRVRILDMDAVNALSLTGGAIYVYRGLLDFVRTELDDSDDALACVLAHELVHVQLRHGLGMLDLVGGAQDLAAGKTFDVTSLSTLMRGLSRKHEFEADQLGSLIALRAGFDPAAAYRFHRALQASGREVPSELDHPTHAERADRLREYLLGLRARARQFDLAVDALGRDRPEAAVAPLETFLAVFPDNLPARMNLGVALHRLAAPGLARGGGFRLSTDVDPRHGLRPLRLRSQPPEVVQSQDRARMQESVALLTWVVARAPGDTRARTNLAASLLALGRGAEAQAALAGLPSGAASAPGLENDLAVARLLTGQADEGRRLLAALVQRRPELPEARFNLGQALAAAGDAAGARRELLAYLALDDRSGWADLARQALSALPAP
jgi:predicted Zn-dependent protease